MDNALWQWDYVFQLLPMLLQGLVYTILIAVGAQLLATLLGWCWVIAQGTPFKLVNGTSWLLLEFIRNTPPLIQVYFAFFSLPSWGIQLGAIESGIAVLALHSSTFTAEIYRAGLSAIPKGQWEAAHVLGLSRWRTWRRIIGPQVVREALPPLANQLITTYKETGILFSIGVPVMVAVAMLEAGKTFRFFEPFTLAALLYVSVSWLSTMLVRRFENQHAR